MADIKIRRKVKDTVFTDLFGNPKYLLQLYQTLHPEDIETTEEGLKYVTLEPVIVDGIYNDLGFMVNNRLMVLTHPCLSGRGSSGKSVGFLPEAGSLTWIGKFRQLKRKSIPP